MIVAIPENRGVEEVALKRFENCGITSTIGTVETKFSYLKLRHIQHPQFDSGREFTFLSTLLVLSSLTVNFLFLLNFK